jgi:hypothetical protein
MARRPLHLRWIYVQDHARLFLALAAMAMLTLAGVIVFLSDPARGLTIGAVPAAFGAIVWALTNRSGYPDRDPTSLPHERQPVANDGPESEASGWDPFAGQRGSIPVTDSPDPDTSGDPFAEPEAEPEMVETGAPGAAIPDEPTSEQASSQKRPHRRPWEDGPEEPEPEESSTETSDEPSDQSETTASGHESNELRTGANRPPRQDETAPRPGEPKTGQLPASGTTDAKRQQSARTAPEGQQDRERTRGVDHSNRSLNSKPGPSAQHARSGSGADAARSRKKRARDQKSSVPSDSKAQPSTAAKRPPGPARRDAHQAADAADTRGAEPDPPASTSSPTETSNRSPSERTSHQAASSTKADRAEEVLTPAEAAVRAAAARKNTRRRKRH